MKKNSPVTSRPATAGSRRDFPGKSALAGLVSGAAIGLTGCKEAVAGKTGAPATSAKGAGQSGNKFPCGNENIGLIAYGYNSDSTTCG